MFLEEASGAVNLRVLLSRILAYATIVSVILFLVAHFMIDQFLYFPETRHDSKPEDFKLPYEDVSLTTDDGVKLHAWWTGDPSIQTTVLFFHGNAGNISHRLDRIQSLKEPGIRFFLIDYRGYGKSTGKPSEEGLYKDATAAYEYLREHRVPPENIYIFGESLGGAVAGELATRVPSAGVILESTFTSLREMASKHYPFIPAAFVPDQFNTLDRIRNLKAKLLVIHGTKDEIVPLEMGQRLYDRAIEPKSFIEVPGAGHNDLYGIGGESYRGDVRRFLTASKLSK
jgi:fermentation-respiration switch protein FrsA (DUF1100 family)